MSRIYMDSSTIEHGRECPDCLRWYVPIKVGDSCVHCRNHGRPPFPNRLRYLAVGSDISLREIARKTKLSWRTVRLTAQGERSPYMANKRKILRALGRPVSKREMNYVFPPRGQGC